MVTGAIQESSERVSAGALELLAFTPSRSPAQARAGPATSARLASDHLGSGAVSVTLAPPPIERGLVTAPPFRPSTLVQLADEAGIVWHPEVQMPSEATLVAIKSRTCFTSTFPSPLSDGRKNSALAVDEARARWYRQH
jgi:hypothetical protein